MYSAVVKWRRQWYAHDPSRQFRLDRPVVSVGNLSVGGSGKTPIVQYIARLLVERGERPAILARGYARRIAQDGVTVVSDGATVVAKVDTAGDEPLMLAQAVPGAIVVVGANRHLAGRLAEGRLGATVHILDDGFQHLAVARDVDLLAVSEEDLSDRPLPAGRLREPLTAAVAADAALVAASDGATVQRIASALNIPTAFRVVRTLKAHHSSQSPAFAIAAIARPQRFVSDLHTSGWHVVGTMAFRDHHRFSASDLTRIADAARSAAATLIVTTEKDAVRLPTRELGGLPIVAIPLVVDVEPAAEFRQWLLARLRAVHPSTRHPAPSTQHPR
jgi:tetraacyldisaccharide 4'-kinase